MLTVRRCWTGRRFPTTSIASLGARKSRIVENAALARIAFTDGRSLTVAISLRPGDDRVRMAGAAFARHGVVGSGNDVRARPTERDRAIIRP